MARLLLFLIVVGGGLYALASGCSQSYPRDQYYGTDAGTDFRPGMFDAPIDQPPELDAGAD
ncbi:MAG TPA: hypothetical protein VKN99_06155 [Polyangia bacterium]|nr:hypothetical protein [Polyangia bacterium]